MSNRLPSAAQHAIGWHGKLPTVGDFATRRLDANFVATWDDWLSAGLARLRADDPDHWLDAYLASPTWRFLLTPGFLATPLHTGIWTGVVMPSVDRVGRYYPLSLAAPLKSIPVSAEARVALWSWLQCLEDAAVDALQEDWSIDALETELLRLGLPPEPMPHASPTDPGQDPSPQSVDPLAPASMESFFAALSHPPTGAGRACCMWYSEADVSAPKVLCSTALDRTIQQLFQR